ncbi:hypothetical protein [Chitinophaga ginsengisoli]|uniref:Antibiotic biosynthesis monooxygenase n=1 Tax=Chitinophaga ginsengisoli TaxID=363837 RepID=A0A2P8GI03_9BACT|nr:hypothetical protein [Chitinophaga ginsengisoli]PSL33591.1 hypothetical protein CLV42_103574 [Chitinophaga ginsengisoli]
MTIALDCFVLRSQSADNIISSRAAIQQWRNTEMHRMAQSAGRDHVFENYRLRIAAVSRDYGMFERAEVPEDSRMIHDK